MPSDFVHLPYAQLTTPEVSTEWMRYFRQRVEEELRRTNNTLNRVDQNTISVVDELSTVPTPAAASFYSISAAEGTIYVQLSCAEAVTGFELCATTVSGTRKQIMYAESNATTGRGYFEFPSLEAVFLWGRTVNKGTWAEARSGWTQYSASLALQFTNVLTDTITGKVGSVPNFNEKRFNIYGTPALEYRDGTRIHHSSDYFVQGYWTKSAVGMGSHGVRVRFRNHGPVTTSPLTYTGFLFMIPDTAMTGVEADYDGENCYFMGFKKIGGAVYAVIAKYTLKAPADPYNVPYYMGVDTELDVSDDLVVAGYCDGDGIGSFEFRVEDNTFYIYAGTGYADLVASATDTSYLLGSARSGIGLWKSDQSWIDDEIALTIDHVNFITGGSSDSIDPGTIPIDRGGTNNASYTTDQFLEYDSTSGRIQSSGYSPTSFAPNPHDILSTYHGDTTAAAVVRGDMIAGIGATPKWERVALGAQNTIWAAGATEPAWTTRAALFGSGTDNYIPKFVTGATPTFGDSIMSQTGTTTVTTLCSDAVTNAVTNVHIIGHDSSGTPAAGYGGAIKFQLESSTTAAQDAAQIAVSWTTATHATRTSKVEIWDVHNGTLTPFLHQTGSIYNLFLGHRCGNATLTGIQNVGFGALSLLSLTTGGYNLGFGYNTLNKLQDGNYNTAIGYTCLQNAVSVTYNCGVGYACLQASTGSYNTACGASTLYSLGAGEYNTAVGFGALYSLGTNKSNNTAIGAWAAYNLSAQNGGVFIGHKAGYYETGANSLFIDNAQRASEADGRVKALVYGIFAATTPSQYLYLNSNVIINEDGQDCDFRVESDGDANNIFSEGSTNRVGIGTGTPAVKLDVVGVTRLGDSATNYTEVEADGTIHLVGTATVFDDLRVSINATKSPAVNAPTWTAYKSGEVLAFADEAVNEEYVTFTVQMPHGYKEGTDITPHVHWVPSTDDAADLYVKWGLTYSWANINDDFPAESTVYGTSEAINNEADKHVMTNMTAISGTGKTISSMLICKLFRNSSDAADTYDHDAYLLEFDIHYEIDTIGSRTISAK